VICLSCGLTLSAGAETEIFEQRYDVEAGASLELKNKNGGVTISQWDEPQVRVYAVKKAKRGGKLSKVRIDVELGKTVRVETVYLTPHPRVSVDYDVQVPAGLLVAAVESSNGAVRLEQVEGVSRIETSNGKLFLQHVSGENPLAKTRNAAIQIEDVTGDVEAKTSNGKVDIQRVAGNVDVETSNGMIRVSSVEGMVGGKTSNGKIVVKQIAGLRELKTSNGKIEADIPAMLAENVAVKNSNGAIVLSLAPDVHAELDLKTSNGNITMHECELAASEFSKNRLKGRIGNGGPRLDVKTSNGTIDLYPLR
jgi:DUF4097 and DUF4098 domain-containing protein YvlB